MSAMDDRQRVLESLLPAGQADRERGYYGTMQGAYGPAAAERTAGVGGALAIGNEQDRQATAASLARTHSRFDQSYALEQGGDALTRRSTDFANAQKAAAAKAAQPVYNAPQQGEDPWALIMQMLAANAPPDVSHPTTAAGQAGMIPGIGGLVQGAMQQAQIPGVGGLLRPRPPRSMGRPSLGSRVRYS